MQLCTIFWNHVVNWNPLLHWGCYVYLEDGLQPYTGLGRPLGKDQTLVDRPSGVSQVFVTQPAVLGKVPQTVRGFFELACKRSHEVWQAASRLTWRLEALARS